MIAYLSRKYVGKIRRLEIIEKEDLDLVNIFIWIELVNLNLNLFKPNHLIGLKQVYLKLLFLNVDELIKKLAIRMHMKGDF